jgi:pimeloyl-ACP methyl ester carboxylesterase
MSGFIGTLRLGPAVIVGHSLGSTNALRFAIDYPELVRGVVLAGAFAGYGGKPDFADFYETDIAPLKDPIDPGFVRRFQESTLARPVPEEFLETVVRESLKAPARVWRAALAGCMEDDFVGELHRIAAPTRILWGDRDAYCPRADQDALLGAIPGSRLSVYQGAGHALHWEEPERFAADLTRFVQELSDGAKQSGHRAIGSVRARPMAAQALPQ